MGPGYLVLEYIDGTPPQGPLTPDEAVRLGLQIVSALEAAHHRRILHRDLKPANILVTPKGNVTLLDFGLAKLMAVDGDVTRTMEGTVLGAAAYMSPEQAQGRTLDERSDVFSFGAVLYEVLSGRRAFRGDTPIATITAVINEKPPHLEAPAALERIVSRCLATQPRERFQAMADVKAALEQAVVIQTICTTAPSGSLTWNPNSMFWSGTRPSCFRTCVTASLLNLSTLMAK
jgi:serine/threonine protein kinase